MAMQKITVTSNPGVSNVQDHTQQPAARTRKEQTMSAVSSVEPTTLPTTRVAWYTGNELKKKTYPSLRPKIFTPPPPPTHTNL
jgi:hypothetical protein